MLIESKENEPYATLEEAKADLEQLEMMHPENKYEIENLAGYKTKRDKYDDEYILCETLEQFREFCEDGGWGDEHGFVQDTGIDFETVKGQWFQVAHSRVYLEEK
jgi:hypothetical protein